MAGTQARRLKLLIALRQRYRTLLSLLRGRAVRRHYERLVRQNGLQIMALGGNLQKIDATGGAAWHSQLARMTNGPGPGLTRFKGKAGSENRNDENRPTATTADHSLAETEPRDVT